MHQEYQIRKLKFLSPLHLSNGANFYDQSNKVLQSDTIKSAIFVASLQLGYELIEAKALFDGCRVSSAFPYYKTEYFFPKPMCRIQEIEDIEKERQGKILKKIKYLGRTYFEDLINGGNRHIKTAHIFDGEYVTDTELINNGDTILKSGIAQRVTIEPDHQDETTTFYTERLFFGDEAGLYFFVDFDSEHIQGMFDQALHLLGDNGIGTDRSVGNGNFEVLKGQSSLVLDVPNGDSTELINLSLFCPERTELNNNLLDRSSYQLIKRGGYIASPEQIDNITIRKKSVYMFDVGSVFPKTDLKGKIVDLKPDYEPLKHSIYRDGRPFFVSAKLTS